MPATRLVAATNCLEQWDRHLRWPLTGLKGCRLKRPPLPTVLDGLCVEQRLALSLSTEPTTPESKPSGDFCSPT